MAKTNLAYKITGADKLFKAFARFEKETNANQIKAVQKATFLLHETAVKLIQDNSDGRPQKRSNPNRVVNVSKPGDPPNTDRGRLVQSIKLDFKENGLRGRVGTNLKYGAALEFGTKKMAPRPWLSTAVSLVSEAIGAIFADAFKKSAKDSTK